ncbi:type IA DNA topoisomerase [Alkalicoccus luteus]|uniref:DNA topoisomerase n=1 Tax=Alkalicoccus luteus TaxID=1237094 RepID=A0A969TWG6_9BACI|nr:type IA DNA topoisomerase [Alkalicoccus luteus]NJP37269.1 DNA topoisomerase 3 [Alkalicoccus luteus]
MYLIIAEKPDQASKLAAPFHPVRQKDHLLLPPSSDFPEGAAVVWAIGHLVEPIPPDGYRSDWKRWSLQTLPIIPDRFEYKVKRFKEFRVIERFVVRSDVSLIIHAGDAEREGEAIIRLILDQINVKKPLKRLWVQSLTPASVRQAFQQLIKDEDTYPLYEEAVSRAYADWLVGMNASRLYTLLFQQSGSSDVFSLGRVQTPVLCMIDNREREMESFQQETYWEVEALFKAERGSYRGRLITEDNNYAFSDKQKADVAAKADCGRDGKVTKLDEKKKRIPHPLLYTLSSLQAEANKASKFAPKKTLDTAQRLYTKGYISYPRTDSPYLPAEEADTVQKAVALLGKKQQYTAYFPLPLTNLRQNKRCVQPEKVTDHYAIIPTEEVPNLDKLPPDERKLYDMIVKRVLAAHYPPRVSDTKKVETTVSDEAVYASSFESVTDEGWRKVLPVKAQDRSGPPLQKGEEVHVSKTDVLEKQTQPPKRYTEGDLITLMKTCGKLLSAEDASVLKETEGIGTEATRAGIIQTLKQRGYIQVSQNSVYIEEKGRALAAAVEGTLLASPEMTAKWEKRLKEIGAAEKGSAYFIEQVTSFVQHLVKTVPEQAQKKPFPKTASVQTKKKAAKRPASAGKCPLCSGTALDYGTFVGCSNYKKKNCGFSISKKILTKSISRAQIKKLLSEGSTDLIKGFKRGETTFQARLVWNKEKQKIQFDTASDKQM